MAENKIKLNICYGCMRELEKGQKTCPFCGYDSNAPQNGADMLPEGTVLFRKYLIGRVLGRGGFGITYLGYDLDLQLTVAIKEYFPREVCRRASQSYDVLLESDMEEGSVFSKGREVFLNEARMLAKFNSPYIVHVREFFREHETAYIVMDYVDGITLRAEMKRNGGKLPYERVLSLMEPLIQQLERLHKKSVIHRDIKPYNIMLVNDENGEHLVLLDFGAAREYVSNETKTMTGVVTPGYSPLEQYSHKSRQGAYTDVYALCATMYHAISGVLPPASIERNVDDTPLKSFKDCGVIVPRPVEQAIMHGLALKSTARTQTMDQLWKELKEETSANYNGEIAALEQTDYTTEAKTYETLITGQAQKQREANSIPAETSARDKHRNKSSAAAKIVAALFLVVLLAGSYVGFLRGRNESGAGKETAETSTQTPTQTATSASTPSLEDSDREEPLSAVRSVGDIVTFGTYEQDNNDADGKEEIEWVVLDIQDNKALLLSRYALDYKPFHNVKEDVTWETSSLRAWLNADFLSSSFEEEEQQYILTTRLKNDQSQGMKDSVSSGNDTYDRVFLLSNLDSAIYLSEAMERCVATQYVAAQGYTYETWMRWWLRSAGRTRQDAGNIDEIGNHSGYGYVCDPHGVRPAIWVELPGSPAGDWGDSEIEAFRIIGNTVRFGTYEQGYNTSGRKDPIEWTVLDVQDNRSLLISRYSLDCKPFHDTEAEVTWETSSLRSWLNNTFLIDAFSSEEQRLILKTHVDDSLELGLRHSVAGNDTEDLIFLLSGAEAEKYFGTDQERCCKPTHFARLQGALITVNSDYEGNCTWWLRSQVSKLSCYYVGYDGSMTLFNRNDAPHCAVRPAIWINNAG